MTTTNTPEPTTPAPLPPIKAPSAARSGRWSRSAIVGAVLVGGVALGAGGLAAAAPDSWRPGWMQHGGSRIERLQMMARRTLDSVGATSDQEDKVHDIIANTYTELDKSRDDRQAFRKEALDLLKAPTLDSAAIEKMRADRVAKFDADSKVITKAVTDIAGVLTPEQRVKVADRIAAFMAHGPMGWGHGPGRHGGWGDHRPGRDRGPDGPDGPDGGPGPQPD
jgi:Spy/CpxP family protein refolding chaperone